MLKLLSKYNFIVALCCTVIIFGLCSTPGRFIPTTSWLELLSFDKFVHASIFFALSYLWLVYVYYHYQLTSVSISLTILLCIAYGGSIEIMQATIFSQRSGDWLDFIANSFGCFIGLLFFSKKKRWLEKSTIPENHS
jgi:VanZ family protein